MISLLLSTSTPLITPLEQVVPKLTERHKVIIFNNDQTPYETVIRVLMESTGCDLEEATIETWEAHHFGKAEVHFAGEPACHAVAQIIRTVGIVVEVAKEWND